MGRITVLFVPIALLCSACADEPDDGGFLEELQATDYRSFDRAPGYDAGRTASQGPHGTFVEIYVNDLVQAALEGPGIAAWPEGSLIVKDGWNSESGDDLRYVSAMEKRDGKWFWAEYRDDDSIVAAGLEEPACTRCHDGGSDGTLAFGLPE